jgi:hypothetical protein
VLWLFRTLKFEVNIYRCKYTIVKCVSFVFGFCYSFLCYADYVNEPQIVTVMNNKKEKSIPMYQTTADALMNKVIAYSQEENDGKKMLVIKEASELFEVLYYIYNTVMNDVQMGEKISVFKSSTFKDGEKDVRVTAEINI